MARPYGLRARRSCQLQMGRVVYYRHRRILDRQAAMDPSWGPERQRINVDEALYCPCPLLDPHSDPVLYGDVRNPLCNSAELG
jgi:hypothetical protein